MSAWQDGAAAPAVTAGVTPPKFSACLRSRRACVSVVVPRAASGVGLAECELKSHGARSATTPRATTPPST
eukprot:3633139-Prymnesium_polylepis.1